MGRRLFYLYLFRLWLAAQKREVVTVVSLRRERPCHVPTRASQHHSPVGAFVHQNFNLFSISAKATPTSRLRPRRLRRSRSSFSSVGAGCLLNSSTRLCMSTNSSPTRR